MTEGKTGEAALIFGFAHDLRTCLRTVLTRIQLVQMSEEANLSEQDEKYLMESVSAATDMNLLLNAMVSYFDVVATPETTSLKLLLRGLQISMKSLLEQSNATLQMAIEPDCLVPKAMQTVMKELISNSCRFRRIETAVIIRVDSCPGAEGTMEITVSDNGTGVEAAFLDKIFLPFQRLHGRNEYPGFGLGLALCKRILDVNGGTIMATLPASGGLSVHVTLPAKFPVQ